MRTGRQQKKGVRRDEFVNIMPTKRPRSKRKEEKDCGDKKAEGKKEESGRKDT